MPETMANFSTVRERIIDLLRNKRTQFPTLPVIARNIIEISRDPDTSAKDLAAFIKKDQAIANKVLRLANSSYYGMGRKVDSVIRAITIIGFEEIIGLAVGIGMLPSFKSHRIAKVIDMRELWLLLRRLNSGGCVAVKLPRVRTFRRRQVGQYLSAGPFPRYG